MTLMYDDNWGVASVNWPKIVFETDKDVERAFVSCSKEHIVPYGSYVKMNRELRVETYSMKDKLRDHLCNTTLTTWQVLVKYNKY